MRFIWCLQLLFIALKLADCISWSWWWVISPNLTAIVLLILILALTGGQMQFISEEERKLILATRYQEIVDALRQSQVEPSESMKAIARIYVEDAQDFKEKNQPKQANV